jgi:hypothetical protein
MPRRLALLLLVCGVLGAAPLRKIVEAAPARAPCAAEGRGTSPRHWLGCASDEGPPRALADDERLALGLPLDPNLAGERALSFVPGLSRRLAAAVVRERETNGRFVDIPDLLRVRGIGPKRLALARPHLLVAP